MFTFITMTTFTSYFMFTFTFTCTSNFTFTFTRPLTFTLLYFTLRLLLLSRSLSFTLTCTHKSKSDDVDNDDSLHIERDSLITLKCKRGKSESVESYRVLAFFTKHYNKWFIAMENKFPWRVDMTKRQNVRVLAKLMKKSDSTFGHVKLEKDGDWGPQHVHCIKHFKDILEVGKELLDF